jgi:meso-butanediol dehydrogenase/(S,S)-butanediol dehydrogenase/diacetyl reductase
MVKLAGKHVVVTGASSGIGAELCRQLGAQGCRVTLAARRRALLNQVAQEVEGAGGRAFVETCDITERDAVFELAESARERCGGVDIWVNNAGGAIRHKLLDASEEDMLAMWRLNCLSVLWAYQAVVPRWLEHRRTGQLIDVASLGAKTGFALFGGYCAAKHGMSALGDTLRQELIGTKVTLTTVYPGLTVSGFGEAVIDRTGGDVSLRPEGTSETPPWLVRKMTERQSSSHVARCIVRAMQRPVPTVYPHRLQALAALIANLWPGFTLSTIRRARQRQ